MSATEKTMYLVSAPFQEKRSFRLIAMSKEAPYSEGIYEPESKTLVLLSAFKKDTFHMVPKLDDNGDTIKTKNARPNGKTYKEQRVTLESFVEYYIEEKEEIENLINRLAINSQEFDYKKYTNENKIIMPSTPKIEIVKS